MSYEDILAYVERIKEAPKALKHMDYEDICTFMIHDSTKKDPFVGLEEEVVYKFLLSIGELVQNQVEIEEAIGELVQIRFLLKKTSRMSSHSLDLQPLLLQSTEFRTKASRDFLY